MTPASYWCKLGNLYDIWARSHTYRAYRDNILSIFQSYTPGKLVYDPGCGCGQYAIALANLGYTVIATDISESMLKIGLFRAGSNPNIDWAVEDLTQPILRTADHFDAILSIHSLFSIFDNIEPILAHFFHCLRPGGIAIIAGRNRRCPMTEFVFHAFRRFGILGAAADLARGLIVFGIQRLAKGPASGANFSHRETIAAFKSAGFEILKIEGFSGYFSQHDVITVLRKP